MVRRLLPIAVALAVLAGAAARRPARATGGNPLEGLALSEGSPRAFEGRVVERLRAGPYTYLRVRTGPGLERWVASLTAGLSDAEAVEVKVLADAPTFVSRRLSRSFSPLFFGVVREAVEARHQE